MGDAVGYVLGGGGWGGHAVECGGGGGCGVGDDGPDSRVVVGAAGGEVADVGGEEHAGDVGCVGGEGAHRDEGGDVAVLDQFPDVDIALRIARGQWLLRCCEQIWERVRVGQGRQGWQLAYRVAACAQQCSITGNSDARDGDIFLGDELVRAFVLS